MTALPIPIAVMQRTARDLAERHTRDGQPEHYNDRELAADCGYEPSDHWRRNEPDQLTVALWNVYLEAYDG